MSGVRVCEGVIGDTMGRVSGVRVCEGVLGCVRSVTECVGVLGDPRVVWVV